MGLLRQPTSDITKGVIWKQLLAFFFPLRRQSRLINACGRRGRSTAQIGQPGKRIDQIGKAVEPFERRRRNLAGHGVGDRPAFCPAGDGSRPVSYTHLDVYKRQG